MSAYRGRPQFNAAMKAAQGRYLRDLRENLGLTQAEMAKAVGISEGSISLLEIGYMNMPRERIEDFARVYGVEASEFTKRVLSFRDPWTYVGIFGPLPDDDQQQAFEIERANYQPEPDPSPKTRRKKPQ